MWQIKKFATNLDSSQKRQIEDSFARVVVGPCRKHVQLGDWYLVMPLDPTKENFFEWFESMPDRVIHRMNDDAALALTDAEKDVIREWRSNPARIIDWKGLTFCEALSAKHWYVRDYYLHGGSERISSAVSDLAQILRGDIAISGSTSGRESEPSVSGIINPADLSEHLARIGKVLDGDPHFRYGISVDPFPPPLSDEPGLVAATQERVGDGPVITFRIYARFDEATKMRPIPTKVDFVFEQGSEQHQQFEEWRKYGKPFSATVNVDSDLPGGLGGKFEGGTVSIVPVDLDTDVLRQRIVTPSGDTVAELEFQITRSQGIDGTGLYLRGVEPLGYVTLEVHFDLTTQTEKSAYQFGQLAGREAAEVATAVRFAAGLVSPNKLGTGKKRGPILKYSDIAEKPAPLSVQCAQYVDALAVLQDFTTEPLLLPPAENLTHQDLESALTAVRLVRGEVINGTWTTNEITLSEGNDWRPDALYQVDIIRPLVIQLGGKKHVLGAVEDVLYSVKVTDVGDGLVRFEPGLNRDATSTFMPDAETPPAGQIYIRRRLISHTHESEQH